MDFKQWAKAAGIRALKTICQTAVAMLGVGSTMGDMNWVQVGSTALLAGIISILTSVGGLPEVPDNTNKNNINKKGENTDE